MEDLIAQTSGNPKMQRETIIYCNELFAQRGSVGFQSLVETEFFQVDGVERLFCACFIVSDQFHGIEEALEVLQSAFRNGIDPLPKIVILILFEALNFVRVEDFAREDLRKALEFVRSSSCSGKQLLVSIAERIEHRFSLEGGG